MMEKTNVVFGILVALLLLMVACGADEPAVQGVGEYEGTALQGAAPDFTLTDQHGQQVSLSDFRGQVVALTFMDSHCEETCPLTSVHLKDAYEALPQNETPVVFLGVNVNTKENEVEDVAAATEKWRLDEVPTWHFLTGEPQELEPVWQDYGVGVISSQDGPEDDAHHIHSSGIFLIDTSGEQRWYISTPFDETGASQGTAPLSEILAKQIQTLQEEG